MKRIENILAGTLLLLAAVYLFSPLNSATSSGGRFSLSKATTTASNLGTSTVKYLDPATSKATTTLAFASANTDHVDLNLQFNASSTNSTLQFVIEHSDNNIDWYCEVADPVATTGTSTISTYGAKCPIHSWTPGQSGISRRSFALTDIGTRFMRVKFNTKDDNGSLYAEPILRQPN